MKITMMYLEINQKDKICRIKIQVHISKEWWNNKKMKVSEKYHI
jgi:hypothetical protein